MHGKAAVLGLTAYRAIDPVLPEERRITPAQLEQVLAQMKEQMRPGVQQFLEVSTLCKSMSDHL